MYDATSTAAIENSFWNSGNSSSSQRLVHIPASLAAGTYIFDIIYTDGLVMNVRGGTLGSSTITYR